MVESVIINEEETCANSDIVLYKDSYNTMKVTCEQ